MDTRTEHYISIAAGIGGLDLGVEYGSGGSAEPVCYVEIEATACAVLAARMAEGALPAAPVWSDVHTFDGTAWSGLVDGVVGGYPCQPFSTAGRRGGHDDPRNLWPSMARIISEVRPAWCFFENVAGHLSLGYFDRVKPELEELGYRVEAQIARASDVGAPHQRERLFILAVANTDYKGLEGGRHFAKVSPEATGEAPGIFGRSSAPLHVGTLAGFPAGPENREFWEAALHYRPDLAPATEYSIRRVADGTARGLSLGYAEELRLLGNAVVPEQAELAWRILWDVHNGRFS